MILAHMLRFYRGLTPESYDRLPYSRWLSLKSYMEQVLARKA